MRVLLDECLPKRLKQWIAGHEVVTVPEAGWAGKDNGELVTLAAGHFEVFLTVDQNLAAQQDLGRAGLAVIVLRARSNRLQDLEPLIPKVMQALESIRAGELVLLVD
ncbi:MAG: DUF5615 family PIN-like protein [Candidatus Binatia bacterium]